MNYTVRMIIASIAGILSSCSEHVSDMVDPVPLQVDIETAGNATRSIIEDRYFHLGDQIGLFVQDQVSGLIYSAGYGNCLARCGADKWEIIPTLYLDSRRASVLAYYPYSSIQPVGLNMGKAQIDMNIGQTDYMYGYCSDVNSVNPRASITMRHALSCIRFVIRQENCTSGCVLSGVDVSGNGVFSSAKLDLSDGSISELKRQTTGLSFSYPDNGTFLKTPMTKDFILLPVNVTDDSMRFIFRIDGKKYSAMLPEFKMEAGKIYTFDVRLLGKNTIVIGNPELPEGGMKIDDWNAGDGGWSYTGW